MSLLNLTIDRQQVATVSLQRSELHNAFNAELISELTKVFIELNDNPDVRVIVLTGAGKSFSAGADLNWMRSMADASEADNCEDSLRLAAMFRAINTVNKPVIARVNGHAFGGGVGMMACADVVIAVDSAKFGLSEVKLGLIPATIAPFVQAKIGVTHMRCYAISGALFDATEARRIGLVHTVVDAAQLDEQVELQVKAMLQAGPKASAECKRLIDRISQLQALDANTVDTETAAWIARLRVSDEGQEGLQAFLNKQSPNWRQ